MNHERRNFIKKALGIAMGVGLAGRWGSQLWGESKTPTGNLENVKLSDPLAVTLGYQDDAKKVDVKKFPKRAGPEGQKEFCNNCQLYSSFKNGRGQCQLFGGKLVAEKGWCSGWVKNPKAKLL